MTGTGTQADPYVVENFDDLLNVSGGSSKYYKLGTDIDANDTPYATEWQQVTFNCLSFDGDGHTIRNIVMDRATGRAAPFYQSTSIFYLKNITFENIYLIGTLPSIIEATYISNQLYFNNINVSMRGVSTELNASTSSYLSYRGAAKVYDSSLFFDITEAGRIELVTGSVYDTQIKLNLSSKFGGTTLRPLITGDFNGSYIIGKAKNIGDTTATLTICDSTMSNSYFAFELTDIANLKTGTCSTVCFIDNDIIGEGVTITATANLYTLTTAQCQSAAYLQSIGFVCAGD